MAFLNIHKHLTESPEPRHHTRHRIALIAKWTGCVVIFPILLGLVIAAILIHSSRGHAFLINLMQNETAKALGVGVHVGDFKLHLANLSVDLYGLKIDGASPHPAPPLLQVQHAEAGIRIVSLFGHKWYIDSIRIDNPVAHILVDKNGISNLPKFNSGNSSSNTSVFDLGIRHTVLTNGTLFYNDQPKSIAADIRNLEFDSAFSNALRKYSGTLTYSNGEISYAGRYAPPHAISIHFDATPNTFLLSPAKIQSGNTLLVLTATVNNYSTPVIDAHYNATLDGQQIANLLGNSSIPAGLVSISGDANYKSNSHRALLQNLVVHGNITSREIVAKAGNIRAAISNVAGHYSLTNGDATLRDFRAALLGGEVTAQASMKNIGSDNAHSTLNAALKNISLADAKRTAGSAASTGSVVIAGTLNATATASCDKSFADLVAHTDATINADVANAKRGKPAVVQTSAEQNPSATPPANTIPIEGALHATYSAKTQQATVDNSYFRMPQSSLTLNGTISRNSSLAIRLQANDLRELERVADAFRTPGPGQPIQQLGLAGTASFNGVVRGSTSAPHLTGQFSAQNLRLHGSSWKLIRTNVDASPSNVSLQNAELVPSTQGRLTLNADARLQKWSFSKSTPIQLRLNATQLDLSDLAKITGSQVPVTGTLAAKVSVHGTLESPVGDGNITLTKAAAYGEPITSARVILNGSGSQVHANIAISAPAGSINGNVTTDPKAKTYIAELTSPGIDLSKLEKVKSSNMNPTGVVTVNAKGQGTYDNPQVNATVQIPNLVVQQQKISNVRLQTAVANHVATAQLTSSAVNTAIIANAKITLTDDYLADAKIDTQSIPLGPLLATYAPAQAGNVNGQTELHATLHGPLKKWKQIVAHATIPVLKLGYSNTVQLAAAAPIHIDYQDGILNVQRSSIRGTDTDLHFQATVPTAGKAPMSVLLLGTVDMHLAQLFNPDLRTSGQIKFNINSYGAAQGTNVEGTIQVVDASMASADLPVGLQHANGVLTLNNDRINVTQFQGNVGSGTVTAQGGVALRPSIQFDLGLAARDIRMLYPQGMRETINAHIRFTGTTENATLGGNVELSDLSFTPGFDMSSMISQFSSGAAPPPSQGFAQDVALNLALRSTSNMNLVSRTLSVGGSANLQIRGTAADPVILGRINLTGGDVILNGNRYVLTGGTIQFVNPSLTQPVVNLNITTTIQQYNIDLRFNGPVDQMRTQYSSNPALPQADIIHLLAFGQTTEASAMSATPANQAAESLVANQVSSQLTSRISKAAGISQLSISPVLANSNSQGPAGADITIQQRVTSNLFITFSTNVQTTQGQTIQGQYQVSPRVALSATRDPNGGFAVDALIKKTW